MKNKGCAPQVIEEKLQLLRESSKSEGRRVEIKKEDSDRMRERNYKIKIDTINVKYNFYKNRMIV